MDALGTSFINALAAQDFETLEHLFTPEVRFRAMVPSGERLGNTAGEATGWLRKWFGGKDTLQVLQSAAGPVFDRLYLSYQLRLHDQQDGWRVIEQQAYGIVKDGKIADLWLVCSGFRPDQEYNEETGAASQPSPQSRLGGTCILRRGIERMRRGTHGRDCPPDAPAGERADPGNSCYRPQRRKGFTRLVPVEREYARETGRKFLFDPPGVKTKYLKKGELKNGKGHGQ